MSHEPSSVPQPVPGYPTAAGGYATAGPTGTGQAPEPLPAGPLPPGPVDPLQPWPAGVDWRPVSGRYIWVEELQLFAGVAVMVAACLVAAWLLDSRLLGWAGLAVFLVGLVRAVFVVRSVRAWGYAERGEDLLVRHGLLVRRLSIVPYARMQFVDVTAGPLERMLGLATVVLHTAAAASDARVPGLAGPEAARLRDRLAALGEARQEGL